MNDTTISKFLNYFNDNKLAVLMSVFNILLVIAVILGILAAAGLI